MGYAVEFIYLVVALLITLTIHEASHALAAYYLGDPTAKNRGRLSLNPIVHLDPLGTLMFFMTQRIGWGKPVPVDYRNFKNPVRDGAYTALAGPASNFVLAFVVVVFWKYLGSYMPGFLLKEIQYIFHLTVFLGIFNLLPFPPLDGSKVLGLFIPKQFAGYYDKYLEFGAKYFIAVILFDVVILSKFVGFSLFGYLLMFFYEPIVALMYLGT